MTSRYFLSFLLTLLAISHPQSADAIDIIDQDDRKFLTQQEQDQYPFIGKFLITGKNGDKDAFAARCMATLIWKDLVVTDAGCLALAVMKRFGVVEEQNDPKTFQKFLNQNLKDMKTTFGEIKEVHFHKDYLPGSMKDVPGQRFTGYTVAPSGPPVAYLILKTPHAAAPAFLYSGRTQKNSTINSYLFGMEEGRVHVSKSCEAGPLQIDSSDFQKGEVFVHDCDTWGATGEPVFGEHEEDPKKHILLGITVDARYGSYLRENNPNISESERLDALKYSCGELGLNCANIAVSSMEIVRGIDF